MIKGKKLCIHPLVNLYGLNIGHTILKMESIAWPTWSLCLKN